MIYRHLALLLFLIYTASAISVMSQKKIEIVGQLINDGGTSIEGSIYWFYEPTEAVDNGLITGLSTLDDGSFGVSLDWKKGKRIRFFIDDRINKKLFCPIDIATLKKMPQFRSLLISTYQPRLMLGKIKPFIRYGKIVVDLQNQPDNLIERLKQNLVYLTVKDTKRNNINNNTISPAYIDNPQSLEFCLPEGEWVLELEDSVEKKKIFSQKVVAIPNSESCR